MIDRKREIITWNNLTMMRFDPYIVIYYQHSNDDRDETKETGSWNAKYYIITELPEN